MEALEAAGLVGNILTFIDFGTKLISTANDIYASATGATKSNEELAALSLNLDQTIAGLRPSKPANELSDGERALNTLCAQCLALSTELQQVLQSLKVSKKSWKASLIVAWRDMAKKEKRRDLEKRLDQCRMQLNLQVTSLMRSEHLTRLQELADTGKAHRDELQMLAKGVNSLRAVAHLEGPNLEAVEQLRSLLNISAQALFKARSDRVLAGLRFDAMNNRISEIEEAHASTYHWLLDSAHPDETDEGDSDTKTDRLSGHSPEQATAGLSAVRPHAGSPFSQGLSPDPGTDTASEAHDRTRMVQASKLFTDWLRTGHGIFHITGKPGSGKSTLLKFLGRSPKTMRHLDIWAQGDTLVFSSFYFWKPGSELQKSLNGLIRGLLHQLLSHCPRLIEIAFPNQWDASSYLDSIHIDHEEAREAFKRIIANAKSFGGHKFAFFIDGLDEFNGHHGDLAQSFVDWVAQSKNIKILVSSRDWPIFYQRFQGSPHLRLSDLTSSDILQFVRGRFGALHFDSEDSTPRAIERLQTDIVERSEGVFLWVSIILRQFEIGLIDGDSVEDLARRLLVLPTELNAMFEQILMSIPKPDRRLACAMLAFARWHFHICDINSINRPNSPPSWVVKTHQEHFSRLLQFSLVEQYLDDPRFASKLPVKQWLPNEAPQRRARARLRVFGKCKGLLEILTFEKEAPEPTALPTYEILGERVLYIHRSISEFLNSQEFKDTMNTELPDFDPFAAFCQSVLAVSKTFPLPEQFYTARRPGPGDDGERRPDPSFMEQIKTTIWTYRINVITNARDVQSNKSVAYSRFLTDAVLISRQLGYTVRSDWRQWMGSRHKKFLKLPLPDEIALACAREGISGFFLDQNCQISNDLAEDCLWLILTDVFADYGLEPWRIVQTFQAIYRHITSFDALNTMYRREVPIGMAFWLRVFLEMTPLTNVALLLYYGAIPDVTFHVHNGKDRQARSIDESVIYLSAGLTETVTATGPPGVISSVEYFRRSERRRAFGPLRL